MRVPVSWLREYVDLPADLDADALEKAFVRVGLEVEEIHDLSSTVDGPLLVGRVLEIEELAGLKKPIRYCQVDVGSQTRGIICGATNFVAGDCDDQSAGKRCRRCICLPTFRTSGSRE